MNAGDLKFNLPKMLRFGSIDEVITAVSLLLWPILAVVSISIIYSGIRYIMAGGDPQAAAAAKKNLIWGITGLIIAILALVIVTWVPQIFTGTLR